MIAIDGTVHEFIDREANPHAGCACG